MFPMEDGSLQLGNGTPPHYAIAALTGNESEILRYSLLSFDMALFLKCPLNLCLRTNAPTSGGGEVGYSLSISDLNGLTACFYRAAANGKRVPLSPPVSFEAQIKGAYAYNNYKIGVWDEGNNVRLLLYVNDHLILNCLDTTPNSKSPNDIYTVFQGNLSLIRLKGTDVELENQVVSPLKTGQYRGIDCYDLTPLTQYSWRDLYTAFAPLNFISSQNTHLPYRLLLPARYSPSVKYPFVLYLTGAGPRGSDNLTQLAGDLDQLQMLLDHQKKEPFILLIPQCPQNLFWANYDYSSKSFCVEKDRAPLLFHAVVELAEHVSTAFSVDPARRYIAGCFEGGGGAIDLLCRKQDFFAAAFIGFLDYTGLRVQEDLLKDLAQTPLYIVRGITDTPASCSIRELVAALHPYQDPVCQNFSYNENNFIPAKEALSIMDWLFSHTK